MPKLTAELLDNITQPEDGKSYRIMDTEIKGLCANVSKTGSVSLSIYRSWKGKPFSKHICRWREMGLKEIRKIAEQINAQLAKNENPNQKSQEERESITLKQAFDDYNENTKHERKSWKYTEKKFNLYLKRYHNKPLVSINQFDVKQIMRDLADKGYRTTANRVRTMISTIYNWAIEHLFYPHANPTVAIKPYEEQQKERFLQKHEITALLKSCDDEGEPFSSVIKLCLFVGLRIENCLAMKFEWIDFEHKTLTIPASSYKTKKTKVLPLSQMAVNILMERLKIAQKGQEYVFPRFSKRRGTRPYMSYPKWAWIRILERAGLKNVRLHDLRHTFCSSLMKSNCSMFKAKVLMGHEKIQSTERYSHLNIDETRAELEKASEMFDTAS